MPVKKKDTETYKRDGIEYEITVDRGEVGLIGKWRCQCGAFGVSLAFRSSAELAVSDAKKSLTPHHRMKH